MCASSCFIKKTETYIKKTVLVVDYFPEFLAMNFP